jgi:hypothetical protein
LIVARREPDAAGACLWRGQRENGGNDKTGYITYFDGRVNHSLDVAAGDSTAGSASAASRRAGSWFSLSG